MTTRQQRRKDYLGPRKKLTLRLLPAVAEIVEAEAIARGMSTQAWIELVVISAISSSASDQYEARR